MENYIFNSNELEFEIDNIIIVGMKKKSNSFKILSYEDLIMKKLGWTVKYTDSDRELVHNILYSIYCNTLNRLPDRNVDFIKISPDEIIFRLLTECYDIYLGARDILEKHIVKAIRRLYKKNPDLFTISLEKQHVNVKY